MKKFLVNTLVLGLLLSSAPAFSAGIAVVDVQEVVVNSAQVKKLEADRIKQEQSLQTFLTNAKKAIDAEKNETKKKALQEKYNKELAQKLIAQKKEVAKRTEIIEKSILDTISKEAKAMGYDMVIQKNSVLYGGVDITDAIIKKVK